MIYASIAHAREKICIDFYLFTFGIKFFLAKRYVIAGYEAITYEQF
jgi:hypothetical protein